MGCEVWVGQYQCGRLATMRGERRGVVTLLCPFHAARIGGLYPASDEPPPLTEADKQRIWKRIEEGMGS